MIGERSLILVTNDDGIEAKGIHSLVEIVSGMGDIVVIAPDGPRSGQSCALTVSRPLRLRKIKTVKNIAFYKINGTPVDCVKLAINEVLGRKPDMILSGINHGSNSAISTIYSGTMGAAYEGAVIGVPSVGFSLCSHDSSPDFSVCRDIVLRTCTAILQKGLPRSVCLNINVPYGEEIKGEKICRQAMGYWTEEYDKRIDPHGDSYYWLTGRFINTDTDREDTDIWALANGYISIVPTSCDKTAIEALSTISDLYK